MKASTKLAAAVMDNSGQNLAALRWTSSVGDPGSVAGTVDNSDRFLQLSPFRSVGPIPARVRGHLGGSVGGENDKRNGSGDGVPGELLRDDAGGACLSAAGKPRRSSTRQEEPQKSPHETR